MVDTFWSTDSFSIEVDENNIDDFKLVAIKDDITSVNSSNLKYYNSADIIRLALDSSGEFRPYILKSTKMSAEISVKVLRSEIEGLYSEIEYKKSLISKILKGEDSRFDTFNTDS